MASKRSSPPTSYSSGTSVADTAGGSGRAASASRQARYSATTRGCSRASSQASASWSSKTIREIAARSMWPASSRMPVPKRSSSAARTSSSSRRSRWTMSSLETVAAPCRANACSASVFPAPMPPVIATATGRDRDSACVRGTGSIFRLGIRRMPEPSSDSLQVGVASERLGQLLLFGFGRRRGSLSLGVTGARLVRGLGVRLDAVIDELGRQITRVRRRGLGGLAARRLDDLRRNRLRQGLLVDGNGLGDSLRLRKNLFRKVEIRRSLDRLRVVGTRHDTAPLDAFERERQPTALAVDLDDLRLHLVPLRDDLARVLDVVLGELGDVHEPLDTREDLDESAEGDELGHLAFYLVALAVAVEHLLPGIRLRLLEAERDSLALAVDVEHLDLHVLADLEHLGRVVDMAPGQLADVNQAVHPVEVDEGAEVDDVGDLAVDDVAGVEAVEDLLPLLLALVLQHGAAREHDVVARTVELDHLRAQLLAEKLVEVLDAADVDQGGRQEAAHTEVEDQAALDDLDHLPDHRLARLGRPLDLLPRELEARALLGEDQPAFGVLLREHERIDLFADLNLVLGVDRAANRELGDRDHAFRLVADVDENLVLVDAHDRAVHDLALVDRREGSVVVRDELAFWAGRPERSVVEVRRRGLRLYGLGFWVDCLVRQSGGQYSLGGSASIWRLGSESRAPPRCSRRAARRSSNGPRRGQRGARCPRFPRGAHAPLAGSSSGRTRRR